jgi:hypothetical protein
VHGLVVNVGTKTLGDVEAIALSLASLAETLLFIGDKMLCTCNNSIILNTSNGRINQGAGQIWIGTKTFLRILLDTFHVQRFVIATDPVSAPFCNPT